MFTQYTYQDWLNEPEYDRPELAVKIVKTYCASENFKRALLANQYFAGENPEVAGKTVLRAQKYQTTDKNGVKHTKVGTKDVVGNRIGSRFLFRAVTQRSQFLLSNGVTLKDSQLKSRLGLGFDNALEQMGEKAILHGVSWGYWNADHIEPMYAAENDMSGFVALLDESTGAPMVGLQFWQLSSKRPQYIRVFEQDGITVYKIEKSEITVESPKRAYRLNVYTDVLGATVTGEENYTSLPIVPFFGNPERESEFNPTIKAKIDAYDRILSDFGDNLDRANDVYWVLNNFGGTMDDIAELLEQIQRIKAVANLSDGMGGNSTAEPRTIEVPYAARQTALDILRKELNRDFMALDMDTISGGSLTNVAIEAAMTDLNLAADRLEWQAFSFVQGVLKLIGVESEKIQFKRQTISNKSEIIADIATMREDIDQETALKLNPYIMQEEIPAILQNTEAQRVSGMASVAALQRQMENPVFKDGE